MVMNNHAASNGVSPGGIVSYHSIRRKRLGIRPREIKIIV